MYQCADVPMYQWNSRILSRVFIRSSVGSYKKLIAAVQIEQPENVPMCGCTNGTADFE